MADVLGLQADPASILKKTLSGGSGVSRPDELLPLHLAPFEEKRRRTRKVLVAGYRNWCRGGCTVVEAVRQADEGFALAEFALVAMRHVLFDTNLVAWESHPARLRCEVRDLFRRAIGNLTPHRGGWRVSP